MLPTPNFTYLTQRLSELGISDKDNTFTRVWVEKNDEQDNNGKIRTVEKKHTRDYKIFDADEDGNIVIRYFNLEGQPYRWKKEESKMPRDFTRERLIKTGWYRGAQLGDGNAKYHQDAGSGQQPFFNPGIIKKYEDASTKVLIDGTPMGVIDTLYLVEGEFKSYKGYLAGLDIVGLPSIHGFYNGDIKGKLHDDLQELIIQCKVKNIVFLVDADLLSVKWEENKDLSKRPRNFYGSIKAFRESLQLLIEDEKVELSMVYFMHLKLKFLNDAKGLDDLLCKYTAVTKEILDDLRSFQFAKKYFEGFIINDLNKDIQGRVFKYLGLFDEQEFYKTYKDFIGAREFKFKRRRYMYDEEAKEVRFVRHEDADKFMRIGPDWVKVISKLNKYGEKEEEIVSWKISEITRDYKKYPDFLEQIMKYDDFCNEPCWNSHYKRVIEGCFNLCEPLKWAAKEGGITNTLKFLKHIFQGQGDLTLDADGKFESEQAVQGDQFTVALDYLTIMARFPKQMLPVPILVSPENNTGKSTFLKWLQITYGSNMVILGNDQFKMKFNGHYITKFIIAIDEGFLEVDKKSEKERLKQLVTADAVYLENKGQNVRKINYYGKVIICSNDADRVMKIDEGENRWFVVRVPVITDKDPDLESKLREEMPAWLHFIHGRKIHHARVDRLWFNEEWFITDQFRIIVEATKNRVDRVFEDWIQEQFLLYKLPVLRYSLSYLTEIFNDPKNSKYRIDSIELKAYLVDRKKMKIGNTHRFKIPVGFNIGNGMMSDTIIFKDTVARPLVFLCENWLTADQLESMKSEPVISGQPGIESPPSRPIVDTDKLPF